MTRIGRVLDPSIPALSSPLGLGGTRPQPTASDIPYTGHVGTDVDAALDARPPTHVDPTDDPTASDDDGDGHVVGCRWINESSGEEFVAVDVSTGAAVWESTTTGGGGSTVDIEDEGSPEGAADTIDFVGSGVSVAFAGGTATVTIPGGGSGTSPEWWDSPNAPAGGSDEEFVGNTVIGTLTRVAHGTPKGTWTEIVDGLEWDQTGTPTTELDTWAVPLSLSTGDHITLAFQVQAWENSKMGAFLGFSNGTTFGTSDAVGAFCTPSAPFIFLLNDWTNFNSRATDGTVVQVPIVAGTRIAVRVHYVAANTWGVSYRLPGDRWRSIQQNYSLTLSPTHAVFGVAMNNNPGSTTTTVRLESFRYNDTP